MKQFGVKLTLQDNMSSALRRAQKAQQDFARQTRQTSQAMQELGRLRVSPKVSISQNAAASVKKLKDAFNSIGKERLMTRVEVQDAASRKVAAISAKLKALRGQAIRPVIALRDQVSAKIGGVLGKLRRLASTFTPVVKLRDLASSGLAKVKAKLGSFKGKATEAAIRVKDMATSGINKVRVGLATVKRIVADPVMRVIDRATPVIQKVRGALSKIGGMVATATVAVKDKASAVLSKVGGALKTAGTAGAAALGGAAVASVKLAADFESGMSNVSAISGATGGALDKLSAKAKEMGAKTKFSAKEATEAYQYMAMAGWKTGDMLSGVEPLMKLAGASGEDLATTSDIVTDGLTAFGMSAKETGRFADVMAAASSNANTNVAMLGESFKYAAPVAGALGFSVEDTSLALGLMANSGIKASSAGTALRSMLTNMAKPTKQSGQALDKLGISLTDSSGKMRPFKEVMTDLRKGFSGLTEDEKAAAAAAIAGKTGMSGLLAVVNSSDKDFNKLSKAIEGSNGACAAMYDTANDNLAGQLTILKSTAESIGIAFGEKLTPFVKKGVEAFQGFGEKLVGIMDPTTEAGKRFDRMGKTATGAFKQIASSAGVLMRPFSGILKGLAPTEGGMAAFLNGMAAEAARFANIFYPVSEAVAGAFGEIGAAVGDAAGQIAPMVAGIASGISGNLSAVIPTVSSFVAMLVGQLPNIVGVIESSVQSIQPAITSIMPVLASVIPIVSGLLDTIFGLVQTVLPVIGNLVSSVVTAITPVLQTVFTLIQTALPVVTGLVEGIGQVVQAVAPLVGQAVAQIAPAVEQVISSIIPAVQLVGDVIGAVLPVAIGAVQVFAGVISAVLPVVGGIFGAVAGVISSAVGAITGVLQALCGFITGVVNGIKAAIETLRNVFQTVFGAIQGVVSSASGSIRSVLQALGGFLSGICGTIKGALSGLSSAFSSAFGSIRSVVRGAASAVQGAVNTIGNAVSGIGQKVSGAVAAAKGMAGKIASAAGFAFGKDRIPYDGYPAILHQGERVLTRTQADQYDRLTAGQGSLQNTRGFSGVPYNESPVLRGGSQAGPQREPNGQTAPEKQTQSNLSIQIAKLAESFVIREEADIDRITDRLVRRLEKVAGNVA